MTINVNVSPSFRIRTVFKLLLELVAKNILFWLFLIVVIDFISWKFLLELWDALQSYPISKPATNLICSVFDSQSKSTVGKTATFLAYFMLLQVVVSPLIYDLLKKKTSDKKIRSEDITAFFQKERGDFILDVMRTLGITILLQCFSLLVSLSLLYLIQNLEYGQHTIGYEVMSCLMILIFLFALVYVAIRVSLAVPIAVIENMGVIMSLIGSWNLTASCWKKIIGFNAIVALMAWTPLVLFYVGVATGVEDFLNRVNDNELILRISKIVHLGLSAIAIAICYYYLCNSNRDNSESDLR